MKTVMPFLLLAGILAAGATSAGATPYFTQDPRTLPEGKWRVETHWLFSDSDESLVDGDTVPFVGGDGASSFTLNTRVRHGATDDLTLFLDIPYVSKELDAGGGVHSDNAGLGDMVLLAKYKIHDDRAAKTRAAVAVATKMDTGEYRDLPPELALGTGQTNWQVVGLAEKESGANTYYASAAYVWTGERDDIDTDPGNATALNLGVEHRLGASPYNLVGEVNRFHQGRFERAGETLDASGSTLLDLSAGVQYAPTPKAGRKLVIETELRVPVRESGYVRAFPRYTYYLGAWMVF